MCDVVFPALKEHFPSCVGGFNTLLCHSSMSYREQGVGGDVYHRPVCGHRACLWQIQMGRLGGSPWLQECLCGLGLSYSAVFPCEGHTSAESCCLTRWEVWGVLFSPIHVPLPASGIFKWTLLRDNLASLSQIPVSKPFLVQVCELQPSGQQHATAAVPPSWPTCTWLLHNFPLG